MFKIDQFELDATDSTNQFVVLSGTPLLPNNVAMDLISGTAQSINGDFGVDGSVVRWDTTNYNLYGLLSENDIIRVIYDRS